MSVCAFFGHREIFGDVNVLYNKVKKVVERLIIQGCSTFLFGSKSSFNDLCYNVVTNLKYKYPHISRTMYTCFHELAIKQEEKIYIEKMKDTIVENSRIKFFDDSKNINEAKGKMSYIIRNRRMIDDSQYCIFYYLEDYLVIKGRKTSGTEIALNYAKKNNKQIIIIK